MSVSIPNGTLGEVFYLTYVDNDVLQVALFSKQEGRALRFYTNGTFTGVGGVPSVFNGMFSVDVLSVINSGNLFDCAFYDNGVFFSYPVPDDVDGRSVIDLISKGPVPLFSGTRILGASDLVNVQGSVPDVKQYLFVYSKGTFPFGTLKSLIRAGDRCDKG